MLLDAPGAKLYYEVRGAGPTLVLVCGGPTDADVYAGVATALADRYRVVTYDPRGNSRSVMDDPTLDQNLDVHGDDLAKLITELGASPAFVFGNSGGGQIGMNALARHPNAIRALIAHEPPCITFLPDGDQVIAGMAHAMATGKSDVMAGFTEFMALTGIDMAPPAGRKQETSERMRANLTYFVQHGLLPIATYRPDLDVLRQKKVVVGVGTESAGQLAHRTGTALANALDLPAVPFPGGHGGYGRYVPEFAAAIANAF
ncbi:MAG TPA: alpha/beta fold hydrolase [Kofleriaceae bacterium]